MKFLLTSDWHLTDKVPRCRTPDYTELMEEKVQFTLNLSDQLNVDYILHGGDVTDSPRIPYEITRKYINILKGRKILTVPGQHDLRYHSYNSINDTALLTMEAAGCLKIIPNDHCIALNDTINIYGCGFGKSIPIPNTSIISKINILVMHKLVSDQDYWHRKVSYLDNYKFLISSGYDLILTGDNHKQFYAWKVFQDGKYIATVNPGSLMRSKSDQYNHSPAVFFYDTETTLLERYPIPIAPWEDISIEDLEEEIEDHEHEGRISELIEVLQTESVSDELGLDFVQNLINLLLENQVSQSVMEMADDIIQTARSRLNA